MDEVVKEDPRSVQNHSSGPEVQDHSTAGHVGQEQKEQLELVDDLSGFSLDGKTSHHHHEQKVSSTQSTLLRLSFEL